jgi:hypothetical protein
MRRFFPKCGARHALDRLFRLRHDLSNLPARWIKKPGEIAELFSETSLVFYQLSIGRQN